MRLEQPIAVVVALVALPAAADERTPKAIIIGSEEAMAATPIVAELLDGEVDVVRAVETEDRPFPFNEEMMTQIGRIGTILNHSLPVDPWVSTPEDDCDVVILCPDLRYLHDWQKDSSGWDDEWIPYIASKIEEECPGIVVGSARERTGEHRQYRILTDLLSESDSVTVLDLTETPERAEVLAPIFADAIRSRLAAIRAELEAVAEAVDWTGGPLPEYGDYRFTYEVSDDLVTWTEYRRSLDRVQRVSGAYGRERPRDSHLLEGKFVRLRIRLPRWSNVYTTIGQKHPVPVWPPDRPY